MSQAVKVYLQTATAPTRDNFNRHFDIKRQLHIGQNPLQQFPLASL